jgi:hypothetical protein
MITWLKNKVRLFIFNIVKDAIEQTLDSDSLDMRRQSWRISRDQSAAYALAHIGLDKVCRDRTLLMDRCLELTAPEGLVLEFGVWKGMSLRHLANRLAPRKVYGFDSFEGLPEAWREIGLPKGHFGVDSLPEVPPNAQLIKGFFNTTADQFLAQHHGPIAFLHIDSDLYSSAQFVLDTYGSRIVPGTVILFDEYMNYPNWMEGEYKAFGEWSQRTGAKYEFIGFVPNRPGKVEEGHQVAVQIKEVGSTDLGRPAHGG